MKITIETIPHAEQRYPTVGDWQLADNGDITIKVSSMDSWKSEALVAVHELIEALLCKDRSITAEEVDAFDIAYEEQRKPSDYSEPGDTPSAPYYAEHQFASLVERMLCLRFGMNWQRYDETVNAL